MRTIKWKLLRRILLGLFATPLACAAVQTCPAGLPLGAIQLRVSNPGAKSPISIHIINRVEEGQVIQYSPVLRQSEKRHGKIAVVLVPASKQEKKDEPFVILEPKPADKPAEWKVPFRVALVAYVYGPNGISTGKVKGFLAQDDELISQLADYAEKTEKTEAVLQALAAMSDTTTSQDMSAALQGFAGQSGISSKIDRTQPMDQQTLAMIRSLNPALSTYDPISPNSTQRMGQTASLAATIAGMFFGSTVGLAAGGTAMLMNVQTLMFPNEEFRSSFVQPATGDSLAVCGKRDAVQGRTRVAYLWAVRIPNAGPPHISISEANNVPLAMKSTLKVDVPESEWKLVERVRNWMLGNVPVSVKADEKDHALALDLSKAKLNAAKYELKGSWDWDSFTAKGDVILHPLSSFEHVHLTPESHDRMVQHGGKEIVQLEGDDFEFVTKVALLKNGDKYDAPAEVPFLLPLGSDRGAQDRLEMKVDTQALDAGGYTLELMQADGKPHKVPIDVLEEAPKLQRLPIALSTDEPKQEIVLRGEHLERIEKIDAGPLKVKLGPVRADGDERQATIELPPDMHQGATYPFQVSAHQYATPFRIPDALLLAGPRTRIVDVKMALPGDLEVALRPGELPAGVFLSAMTHVQNASANASMRLFCKSGDATEVTVRVGEQNTSAKLQAVGQDTLFLSFDPGTWVAGCTLMAALQDTGEEASAPYRLGRVVRVPRIEGLRLTDESAGDGAYFGVLTGHDLEMVAKVGWDATNGTPVPGLPTPIAGESNKQSLKVALPWPSPAPHSPIFVWLRGDKDGRATTVKY